MPIVRVPAPLRRVTDGRAEVTVSGHDVRSVIASLDALHPGFADRLLAADGTLHGFVHVFVGDHDVRAGAGLDTPVADDDTVSVVPAVAGGV